MRPVVLLMPLKYKKIVAEMCRHIPKQGMKDVKSGLWVLFTKNSIHASLQAPSHKSLLEIQRKFRFHSPTTKFNVFTHSTKFYCMPGLQNRYLSGVSSLFTTIQPSPKKMTVSFLIGTYLFFMFFILECAVCWRRQLR